MAENPLWWETYFDDLYFQMYQGLGISDRDANREQAQAVMEMLGLTPPARVLDLCCGFGRHGIPLARMGFQVTGLDYSKKQLARARENALEAQVEIAFHQGDMRALPWLEVFDGCVMLGGSLGVLENDEENQKVLFTVAAALKPGGRFLLDAANRDRIVCGYEPERYYEKKELQRYVQSRFDPVTGMNYAQERWLRGGAWVERAHAIRLYTATELDAMLRRAGLMPVAYYGSYDQNEFTTQSYRIMVVTKKDERF